MCLTSCCGCLSELCVVVFELFSVLCVDVFELFSVLCVGVFDVSRQTHHTARSTHNTLKHTFTAKVKHINTQSNIPQQDVKHINT
jgi:hypothetical protein